MAGLQAVLKLRRWKNSRLPINRLPPEILVMVATYMEHHEMLVGLTHVCTQWRRIITTCPTLWTDVRFDRGDVSLASLCFERAKGCAVDVRYSFRALRRRRSPAKEPILPTVFPGNRIRSLFINRAWSTFQELVERWGDALSTLQVLEIDAGNSSIISLPTVLVGGALKDLKLVGGAIPGLYIIKAPNLTSLRLNEIYETPCSVTVILEFLEDSPALEEVSICANSISVDDFPPSNKTITLPRARRILLSIDHAPRIASHIFCPSSKDIRLVNLFPDNPTLIFPPTLRQLLGQYSVEIIDRVAMCVSGTNKDKACSLRLSTPLGTTFQISCETTFDPDTFDAFPPNTGRWAFSALFDQAISALSQLPLGNVTTFSIDIKGSPPDSVAGSTEVTTKLATVLRKCQKLDEVTLEHYPRCLPVLLRDDAPSIRILIIKHSEDDLWEELVEHVAEVARVRHSRGVPLKRIRIITPTEEESRIKQLESWVQEVEYRVESPQKSGSRLWRFPRRRLIPDEIG